MGAQYHGVQQLTAKLHFFMSLDKIIFNVPNAKNNIA